MVSDVDLASKVHEFLRTSDLKKTTNNIVRRKLETDFGLDLSEKKSFVRDQIDRFLQSQYDCSEDEEREDQIVIDLDEDDVVSESDQDKKGHVALGVKRNNYNNNNNNNNGNGNGNGSSSSSSFKAVNKLSRLDNHTKEKIKRKRSGNFSTLSPQLQKFLGVPKMARAEVVKRLWNYVREKNLQDPVDGKNIVCDETLHDLLGVDSINILQINKALTKHIRPSARSLRKEKQKKQEKEDPDGKMNLPKKVYSGFLAPLPLSDTLMKFLGTGEHQLTRAVVIKRVWDYIKIKNLQDPSDRKTVISDEKLKELFNVDTFHGFTVSKLLSAHFLKTSP